MRIVLTAIALNIFALGLFSTSAVGKEAGQSAVQAADSLQVTPDRASGTYAVGQQVGWTFKAGGKAARSFTYVVRENNSRLVKTGELDLTSGTGRIETRLSRPGMLLVRLTPVSPEPNLSPAMRRQLTVGAAVAPELIRPGEPEPADFDRFWAGKLKAQRAIPMNPTEVQVIQASTGVDMSVVTFDALGSKAHGYLAKPSGRGKHPALIVYQYAGVYKLPQGTSLARAKQGWLVLNIQAHDMPPSEASAPVNYFQNGNTSRETAYFLGMYLRASRAVDYIRSRPEWDGRTIVLTGGSQGGQQSLVAAALNPSKVTAVVVDVPAGAEITGDRFGRRPGFPLWTSDDPAVVETSRYFDVVNFSRRIKAPTLAAVGMLDIVAPPTGIFAAINRIKAPKEAVLMVDADHTLNHDEGNKRIEEALSGLRRSGTLKLTKSSRQPD